MRLPPDPGRCQQRAAADAARFPESFPRPCPAGTSGGRSRPGPSPGASVSGPSLSASRPRHLRRMPGTSAILATPRRPDIPPRADRRFRSIQTGHSVPHRPDVPPAVDRPCSARRIAPMRGYGHKKTGRQPTLGPARGTGYRDASSCRRPAICGKISAQITRRTGTARQPGQPVVQI